MATELLLLGTGGQLPVAWPHHCVACSRSPSAKLALSYGATSDARFFGIYASWRETNVEVDLPVCRLHWAAYLLPSKLVGMSLWHKVVITFMVLSAIGGSTSLGHMVFGTRAWSQQDLQTSLLLIAPFAAWLAARQLLPVRVSEFLPPKVWLRFRKDGLANEFMELNPQATRIKGK